MGIPKNHQNAKHMKLFCAVAALYASSEAFTPAGGFLNSRASVSKISMSRFTDQVWDFTAKKQIYDEWNPSAQRTYDNFNPFERNADGNACDTNGKFPGETNYRDPIRPDASWAIMQADKAMMEEINAIVKPGDVEGAPGRWKKGWDEGLGALP